MPRIDPEKIGGANVAAFLDMLSVSEGTDIPTQPTNDDGYDVIVGGELLTDYTDHPRKVVQLSRTLWSSAAGRYQFLRKTWDALDAKLNLPDFGPVSQDAACVELLKECGAYSLIRAGDFDGAVHAARKIWASLPGAGYGQHEQNIGKLRAAYILAGGFCQCPAPEGFSA